ncbi:hypothetical protein [Mycolicibacterium sphagni]|uniref:Uncharacterized protein n=1 Tax=Mycolicibacterium sphagni TaxID=1786 RepID=A0ABX2K845_9MYCO|nr:hypothetical protein [Mycolicibacterium sphagni]NTY63196.1 hypothetical protein [Mycolicibacterium sphagni]
MASVFFSDSWAQEVRAALDTGPDDAALAAKLPQYWDSYDVVRAQYTSSWALGVRNLPGGDRYLYIAWSGYFVRECRVLASAEPVEASYVITGDYAAWKALCEGYDALRTILYRRLTVEHGELLEFFKTIYFFAESLVLVAAVPTEFKRS